MKQLLIDRGTFRLAMKTTSGEGDPPRWESTPDGMTLLVGDYNEAENGDVQIDNTDLFHVTQQGAFLANIAKRLQLPTMEDLPDARKVAGALKEDGQNICEYCERLDCRMCMIEEELRDD